VSLVSVLSWDSAVDVKNLDEIEQGSSRQDPYVVIEYGSTEFRTRTNTGFVLYFSVYLSTHRLEHPQRCSVCDRAHSNWMNKSQGILVWLSKMVSAQHCSTLNFLDG
jgi:hypothetical protein